MVVHSMHRLGNVAINKRRKPQQISNASHRIGTNQGTKK